MKHILYFVLSFLLVGTTQAQVTSISSINVGGTSFTGISLIAEQNNYGAPEMTFLPTLSYSAGIVANINWYENIGLQLEMSYAKQGQKYFDIQSKKETEATINLTYVQIPLMFKYTFTDYSMSQRAPNLYYLVGPQFGLLQGADLTYIRDGSEMDFVTYHNDVVNPLNERHPDYTTDLDLFNDFELALVSGFGAIFDLSDDLKLTVESRLTWGISDINARDWRFPDLRNQYAASHNYLWGLKVGLVATVW